MNEAASAEHEAHSVPEPLASVRTDRYRYVRRLGGDTLARPDDCDSTDTKELWLRGGWAGRRVAAEELCLTSRTTYRSSGTWPRTRPMRACSRSCGAASSTG